MSMIELLVAVLVMGIGVLGITALQMVSLQNNRAALYRAEAVQLAYDMMDRIRANPAGANVLGEDYDGVDLTDAPAAPGVLCNQAVCTQADMVAYDLAVWKCSLGGFSDDDVCVDLRDDLALPPADEQPGLPDGDGSIAVDNVTGVITVVVRWQEPNGDVRNITIESQG
jgi:type IV pilus assembly protein PilV